MKRLTVLIVLLIITSLLTVGWWKNGLKPVDINNTSGKIFVISQGQGVRKISNNLKGEGLIRDSIVFFLLTKQMGIDKKIEAGDFRLSPSMTLEEIAENLTHGTLDIWVTIPEGKRALEIAEILKAKMPSYENEWKNELIKHEGFLFPDTYLISKDATISAIISLFTNTFEDKYSSLSKKSDLSKNEIVIVASLVEREAKYEKDRPLVASVILNRMKIGMKLDIDATLQYALGYQENEKRWWKKGLSNTDKEINSPYNTYRLAGLPPTPISNPGLAAIKAVLNPATTNYLFYFTDKNGINRYSETLEGQIAGIEKHGL
ncbi:endolytic transglycosylase MltG [Patescibacteria group bacterium]|nr:endolytic transglycosylase MltG [Patescibacteria group bacterium]